jgi:hypothetical protein
VYENAHIVMKMSHSNHPYLNDSKQKTEIVKAHVFHLESSLLHMTRERGVRVLDPKGLVSKYLGTQDLDIHKCTQLIMWVSEMQNLV